jgi:hypothetical protein
VTLMPLLYLCSFMAFVSAVGTYMRARSLAGPFPCLVLGAVTEAAWFALITIAYANSGAP